MSRPSTKTQPATARAPRARPATRDVRVDAPLDRAPARRVRPVPAVSRAVAILRLLGRSAQPIGVKAIATELSIVTSTCLHILRVLVDEELVKVDDAKRYSLGAGMVSLARSVIETNSFPAAVQPVLDRLSQAWSVTAIGVEIAGPEHMVVLALSHSKIPFRLHVDVGSRFPTLISATGRLVAAFNGQPWDEVERRFRALRWQNAPSLDAWRRDLDVVRRNGYAVDRGNYIGGVTVLAVPVFDARRRVTHTIVAAGLAEQLDRKRTAIVAASMQAEAAQVAASLFGNA